MSVTYNLTLYNEPGSEVKALLALDDTVLDLGDPATAGEESAATDTVTVSVYPVTGKITFLNINSPAAALSGVMYVSLLGPILTVTMSGEVPKVSLQYNLIDSPGLSIGGVFSFLGGEGGILQSYCFLGSQA